MVDFREHMKLRECKRREMENKLTDGRQTERDHGRNDQEIFRSKGTQ